MNTEKEKNKNDTRLPVKEKHEVSPDPKEEKGITLAKRSGQRPALPFKRKPPV